MAESIKEIYPDVLRQSCVPVINAKQFDENSRFLRAAIHNNGKRVKVGEDCGVILNAKRADGQERAISGEVCEDGSVRVPLVPWLLAVPGTARCSISIIEGEENKLTTMGFEVLVEPQEYIQKGDITEDENYDILVDLIAKVAELNQETVAATKNADNAATSANEAAERANTAAGEIEGAVEKIEQAYNEITEAKQSAAQAAEDAKKASEQVVGAIETTEAAAENANAAAQKALDTVDTVSGAVEQVEQAAEQAQAATDVAQKAAETAESTIAQLGEFTAKVDEAVGKADTAASNANDAAEKANSAITEMETATQAANTAAQSAIEAKDDAETAAQEAREAVMEVSGAAENANNAALKAETAAGKVDEALSEIETATENANTAASNANKAIEEIGTATEAANTAAENANSTAGKVENALSEIEAATENANTAADNANTAVGKVESALSETETATTAANEAATKADTATEKVNTAISQSETATENANSAAQAATSAGELATTAATSANKAAESCKTTVTEVNDALELLKVTEQEAKNATTNANEAASVATVAARNANDAATSANQAIEELSGAAQEATEAATNASSAADSATTAAGLANSAAEKCESAATSATNAATSANQVAERVETAITGANEAATSATKAGETATQAAENCNTAAGSATKAAEQCNTVTESANSAASAANSAATKADTAAGNAEKATAEANKWANVTAVAKTLDAGAEATATLTETEDGKQFEFGIPKGEKGDTADLSKYATKEELNNKVDKDGNKQLSTNDYTTEDKEKLAGIETGAEVNAIESVKVNGVALVPDAEKAVALKAYNEDNKPEVGGTNLYLGTKDFSGDWTYINQWTKEQETYRGFKVLSKAEKYGGLANLISGVKTGEKYTLSFYAKSKSSATLALGISNQNSFDAKAFGTLLTSNRINVSNDWKRYYCIGEILNINDPQNDIMYFFVNPSDDTTEEKRIYICGLKLERGEIATDWTPAPEDIEEGIKEVEDKVDDISIGGRNLILDSKTLKSIRMSAFTDDEPYLGFTTKYKDAKADENSKMYDANLLNIIPKDYGNKYVFSLYAKGSGDVIIYFYEGAKITFGISSQGYKSSTNDGNIHITLSNEWQRYWIYYEVDKSGDLSIAKRLLLRLFGGNEVYFCAPKFEIGNKATDWSPAPEDLDNEIKAVDEKLNNDTLFVGRGFNAGLQTDFNDFWAQSGVYEIHNAANMKNKPATWSGVMFCTLVCMLARAGGYGCQMLIPTYPKNDYAYIRYRSEGGYSEWTRIALYNDITATNFSGVLPVAKGGTGFTSLQELANALKPYLSGVSADEPAGMPELSESPSIEQAETQESAGDEIESEQNNTDDIGQERTETDEQEEQEQCRGE